jgi:hypothetical protein
LEQEKTDTKPILISFHISFEFSKCILTLTDITYSQCRIKACGGSGQSPFWGPYLEIFCKEGGRGVRWRLILTGTINSGVFEYNSCNIWLESGWAPLKLGPKAAALLAPLNSALYTEKKLKILILKTGRLKMKML